MDRLCSLSGKKTNKFLTNLKAWKTSLKIIWQNRMLYNFPEGMFATNDSPVCHSISNARENPFPTAAWGVASGTTGKRVFFGF